MIKSVYKMKTIFLFMVFLALLSFFMACEDVSSSNGGSISNKIEVFTKSSNLMSQTRNVFDDMDTAEDWIIGGDLVYVTVEGVRGKIESLILTGEDSPQGNWELFTDKDLYFDLSDIQEIFEFDIDQTDLRQEGTLNTVTMFISYIELDLDFKDEKKTIRAYWSTDAVLGIEKGDILVKDVDESFNWVKLSDRSLSETRPADAVQINSADILDRTADRYPFTIDHFANQAYVTSPPPWDNSISNSEAGRLDNYFTITSDTLSKNVQVTLDLSLASAAAFSPYEKILANPDIGHDIFDMTSMPYFEYIYDVSDNWIDIADLEGNILSSQNFTLLDMLPGLLYPDILLNITIEEL